MRRQSTEQLPTAPAAATTDLHGTITTTYRRLRSLGFDECEAGNLTAYVSGIAIGPQPWTVRELTHLLFLREMNHVGRWWSEADDRAEIGADGRLPRGGPRHRDSDSSDGRVTLPSLFRGSGPGANRTADALGDRDREAG